MASRLAARFISSRETRCSNSRDFDSSRATARTGLTVLRRRPGRRRDGTKCFGLLSLPPTVEVEKSAVPDRRQWFVTCTNAPQRLVSPMPLFRDHDEERAARLDQLLERARAVIDAKAHATRRRRSIKKPAKATLEDAKR